MNAEVAPLVAFTSGEARAGHVVILFGPVMDHPKKQ